MELDDLRPFSKRPELSLEQCQSISNALLAQMTERLYPREMKAVLGYMESDYQTFITQELMRFMGDTVPRLEP